MKSELIENLILAHCSGDESRFSAAIDKLAADEEKKGNIQLAGKIRNAYEPKQKFKYTEHEYLPSVSDFSTQSVSTVYLEIRTVYSNYMKLCIPK